MPQSISLRPVSPSAMNGAWNSCWRTRALLIYQSKMSSRESFVKDPNVISGGDLSGSTSTSLLARLRARDRDAWSRLAKLYGPLVYGWCRRRGLRAEDAADV